jgi:hypothetical protein
MWWIEIVCSARCDDPYSLKIFTIFIDLGIQQSFKTIKDDQLGAF